MRYTRLGTSGLVVSRLELGMVSYGDTTRRAGHLTEDQEDQAEPIVRHAVETGVTLFDTADVYDRGPARRSQGGCSRSSSTTATTTCSPPRSPTR